MIQRMRSLVSSAIPISILTMLLISLHSSTFSQHADRNNLNRQLNRLPKTDTAFINTLFKYGETFELDNNDSAFYWYVKAFVLSKEQNYVNGLLRYRDYTSVLLVYLGKYDEAKLHIDTALALSKKYNRKRFEAIEYNQYGTIWQYKNEMNQAASYYIKAFEAAHEMKDTVLMTAVAGNLSGVFLEIKRYEKAREFSELSYNLSIAMQDTLSAGYGLVNLSSCNLADKNYSKAQFQATRAIDIARHFTDEALELFGLNNYASALKEQGRLDSAILIFEKAFTLAKKQSIEYHMIYSLQGLGDTYSAKKNYRIAQKFFEHALLYATGMRNRSKQAELYHALSVCNEENGDLAIALVHRRQYDQLRDSINIVDQNRNISELEIKYQTERKQLELTEKNLVIEKEKNKATTRLFWLIAAGILLIVAVIFIWQRSRIAKEMEQKLKNEMQVNVLKAREDERSRIAKDLHDDVGSTLSSIHVYSQAAQMQWVKKPEEVLALIGRISHNSEQMMDKMSDIIWSMNPNHDSSEALALRLKTYGREVLSSQDIETEFSLDALSGLKLSLEARKNILLIFKEAVNNLSKYSQARHAYVSTLTENGQLTMIIRDDGCGFVAQNSFEGNGLTNMNHRAKLLNGEMQIESLPGKGTVLKFILPIARISDAELSQF